MTNSVTIRALRSTDAPKLTELFERNNRVEITSTFHPFDLNAETARQISLRPGLDRYFGAFSANNEMLAMSMLRGWNEGFDIPSLGMFVDHESQGDGIGRSLLDETLAAARRMHCQKVRLSVSKSNVAAVNLYVSRGFVAVDEDEVQRRGERQSRLIMALNLGEGLTNET